ncbi:MAG TPA: protein kinase [Candidatus Binatia bacterium]|nr:protein kinase [Candidatus Binatia bacterium]
MSETIQPQTPVEGSDERFGDYVLLEKIAQGGMAELFLAKRRGVEGFEKIVAIKRILPELSWNRDFVSMFINEAKIAARLSHPNIVQIFDFGKIDNYYFIAMEYVHGENLRAILGRAEEKKIPLSAQIAALIAARACAGLEHAHRKTDESGKPLGIVHRDVSPQNVLISYDGDVKVVDFGIAKAVAENPEATRGVLKGKLSYLSPEQVNGRNLDARSDIFAMGLVLYELLVGKKLFDQRDPADILDSINRIDADAVSRSIPGLNRALREVLRRALEGDPEQRFRSAGDMQMALDEYLRSQGDLGGTMQLANLMRLLFDDKIGERTIATLRSQIMGKGGRTTRTTGATIRSGSPRRLVAAVGGAALGVVALLVASPTLRASPRRSPPEEPATSHAAPARVNEEKPPSPTTPPAVVTSTGASADLERAKAAIAANQPALAVAAFEKAFDASPELRENYAASYAKALTDEGKRLFESDPDAAAQRFNTAVAADPGSFDAHFYLAKIYTRKSDPEAALREYQEAVRINPSSANAHFNLGFVYFSQRRYEEARQQYEKVLDLKPPYLADVFYNLSACYEQMKQKPEAVATLRRGLEAVPNSDLLRQRLKQLGG